jgi:two-component system sensor histidine kinase DegS
MAGLQSLDRVVRRTLVAVEEGRDAIFGIAEDAHSEPKRLQPMPEVAAEREAAASGSFQEASQDMLEQESDRLIQVEKQANMLLTRFGVALQCLSGAVPEADQAENWPVWKEAGQIAIRMLDNERHRIAREIHDGPAQAMANLLLRTVFSEQRLAGESSVVLDELSSLKEVIRNSLLDIRKILFDLQPKDLDQGLVCGLHRLIEEYQERYGLQVMLNCSGEMRHLGRQATGSLFRIVQEALSNVYKYSCSDHAQVNLELEKHRVTVHICDDGKGFDLQEVALDNGHYGLMNMKERARLLGGAVQVASAPGQGTRVSVTIPIE